MGHQLLIGRIVCMTLVLVFIAACSEPKFKFTTSDPNFLASGTAVSESFTQGYSQKSLDILFVVDNSGSMAEEQTEMGQKIESFLQTLSNVDWRIGITTTDVSEGAYGLKGELLLWEGTGLQHLSSGVPDFMTVFQNTVVREETINCGPVCPSGDEQPLAAIMMAIDKRNNENMGFFRQGADLAVVILSDEDEMSDGPAHATKPEDVVAKVSDVWGDEKRLFAFAMVIPPGDLACYNVQNGEGQYGTHAAGLAVLTGGMVGSICSSDFAPVLGQIGTKTVSLLEFVQLSAYPDPNTIEVKFSDGFQTAWWLEGRRVYFDNPPPTGNVIDVNYLVL